MDLSKTGKLIAQLRQEKGLTQREVAEKLCICAKTVSNISLISKLSQVFKVDISKLLDGEMPVTKVEACNVKMTKFYVCEKCGNIITSIGNADQNSGGDL